MYDITDYKTIERMLIKLKRAEREKLIKMLIIKGTTLKNYFNVLLNYPEQKSIFQKIYDGTYDPVWDDPGGINDILNKLRFARDNSKGKSKFDPNYVETYYFRPKH